MGEEGPVGRKIFGFEDRLGQRFDGAEIQKHEPQDGRYVGHGAVEKKGAVGWKNAARQQQPHMLHIALAPAPVACQTIEKGRGRLLVAAAQVVGQPDFPSGPAHESGFDKVVAEDVTPQRRLAGQLGQGAVPHEGVDPDDGIVPPVLGVTQLPVGQSGRKHGPVDVIGELLHAGDKGFAAGCHRGCLKDADIGILLHESDETNQGAAAHDAVCVQDDHVAVTAPPTAAEIGDIAAFALNVRPAVAVVYVAEPVDFFTQFRPGGFLFNPTVGIG
jgi:hypothetical protein